MQNAPPEPSLGQTDLPPQLLDRLCELFKENMYGDPYFPPAFSPWSPPPGQVQLVEPPRIPEDRDAAREFEQELHRRRSLIEELLVARNWMLKLRQKVEFGLFTCTMLSQQFQIDDFLILPTYTAWADRFSEREVIQRAQALQERHGEVLIVVDRTAGEFELCGPETRGGRLAGSLVASMTPVFDALALRGLWVGTDRQFRELARAVVRLAEAEHARLGPDGFSRRYSSGVAR